MDSPDPRYIEFNINGEKTYSSYEDVQKEYGNVEDYVRKFRGKAKIVTPPKQLEEVVVEGDAEKIADPGEYLTKVIEADINFFSRDYDQIQADLEIQFPDIEFSNRIGRTSPSAFVGTRDIIAKKDGKEIRLFTDILKPRRQTGSTYAQNLKNLKKLLSETYKPEEVKRTKQRVEIAETEALNILEPLVEQAKQSVDYKYFDDIGLFIPYTKDVAAKSFVGGIPSGGGYKTTVRPYESAFKKCLQ